jgi:hypothetical protein
MKSSGRRIRDFGENKAKNDRAWNGISSLRKEKTPQPGLEF